MKWELLLIDDEPCILDALAELLTDDDINVTTATNGLEGLKILQKSSFDIVVSDVSMPHMDGLSMLSLARASGIFTPFVFFSASSDPRMVEKLKLMGASAVVNKPHFEKLSAEINSVLVKHEFRMPEVLALQLATHSDSVLTK